MVFFATMTMQRPQSAPFKAMRFKAPPPKIEAFLLPKALRIKHFQRAIENEAAARFKAPFGKWTKIVQNLF